MSQTKLTAQTLFLLFPIIQYPKFDGIERPIRCKQYRGVAKRSGGTSAGLSGEFTDWITDDSEAVLVRASVKVLLGSITLAPYAEFSPAACFGIANL